MGQFFRDIFDPIIKFDIVESAKEVDGEHVIGKLKGTFFVPDGKSRNKRFYKKQLWEKQLSDSTIQEKLKDKRMFGTISHTQKIDDVAMLEGKISHVITDLKLQKDGVPGYGEALILNTPAGQILNTVLRAGCKLFVSSRANGKFDGSTEDGDVIVDPETYQLESFDFVIDPGFIEANPKVVESLNQIMIEKENEGDIEMKELIESLTKENLKLKEDLKKSIEDSAKSTVILEENKKLKAVYAEYKKIKESLEGFKKIGTEQEIKETIENSKKLFESYTKKLESYEKLGTPEAISKSFDASVKFAKEVKELGEVKEIKEALLKSKEDLKKYKELGTIKEIEEAFNRIVKMTKSVQIEENKKKIASLAKELEVTEDAISKVFGKISESEIKDLFSKIKKVKEVQNTFKKPEEKIVESKQEEKPVELTGTLGKSRINRIFESLNR